MRKATKQAKKIIAKQIDANADELKKEVNAEIDAAS